MPSPASPSSRFRELRERAGLSHAGAARQMGISEPSVWDIEDCDEELVSVYSLTWLQRFAGVLSVHPGDFFGISISETPISAVELVDLIHGHCRARNQSLEQLEESVGWRLSACIEPPDHLFEDITIEGLQWLCQELGISWHRVLLSL